MAGRITLLKPAGRAGRLVALADLPFTFERTLMPRATSDQAIITGLAFSINTAITELVPPRHLGAAYSIRSVLGFGSGVVSPWMFGLVLDWGRGAPLGSDYAAWGLAWMSLGAGAMLGPLMTWRLRQSPDARSMAHGRR